MFHMFRTFRLYTCISSVACLNHFSLADISFPASSVFRKGSHFQEAPDGSCAWEQAVYLCVCMYVCIYIYIYICICIYIYIYTYTYTYIRIHALCCARGPRRRSGRGCFPHASKYFIVSNIYKKSL